MASPRQSVRSSRSYSPAHSRPIQQTHNNYPDPIPAFGIEREFAFDPNAKTNYPSYNARTTIYYPVEPLSIKEAEVRVNAIKASEAYKRLELDQQLIAEFRKVNLENRVYLEELLASEKAKLHHSTTGTSDPFTGKAAEQEFQTPRYPAPEPAYNWLDFAKDEDEQGRSSSPLEDQGDLMPKVPPSSPEDADYNWHDFLAELEEEKRQGNRVPNYPRPEQYGFAPKPEIPTKSKKRTIEFSPSPPKHFSELVDNFTHERPKMKPANKRPGSPWPGKGTGKGKNEFRFPNNLTEPIQELSIPQIPHHVHQGYDTFCEDADSSSEEASSASHSTAATSKASSERLSQASNPFSGLPNLLIPAHPSQKKCSSHEALSSLAPDPKALPELPELPEILAPSPLRPRKTRHSVRTRRPLRHKQAQPNLYWPINHSSSGRYHPIPFPPLYTPDPYVAWPSIPGQFKHRDPHPENADLGPQQLPTTRSRTRSNAISTPGGAAAPFLHPATPIQQPPVRKWSFVRGKQDVMPLRPSTPALQQPPPPPPPARKWSFVRGKQDVAQVNGRGR